jgi:hypothetical protein
MAKWIAAFILAFALGFAFAPAYIGVGVLFFMLGFNAQYVLAVVWRRRRESRVPRLGSLVYLRPRTAPQAVRKEVRRG